VQFTKYSIYNPSLSTYQHGNFFNGTSVVIIFLNFIINYITGNGILVLASIIGIGWLIWKGREKFDIFMLLTFIISCNFFIDKVYFRAIFMLFLAILTGIGIDHMISYTTNLSRRRKHARHKNLQNPQSTTDLQYMISQPPTILAILLLIIITLVSIGFSLAIMNRTSLIETSASQTTIDFSTIKVADFIRENYHNPTIISSDGSLTYMIINRAGASSIDTRVLDLVNIKKLEFNSYRGLTDLTLKLLNIKTKMKVFFQDWLIKDNNDYYPGRHEYALKTNGLDSVIGKNIIDFYDVQLYIVTQDPEPLHQKLLSDAHATQDKVYSSVAYDIYKLDPSQNTN
jgi:hypothetical protein